MRFQGAVAASLFASLVLAVPEVGRRDWAQDPSGSVSAWLGPPSTCRPRTVYTTVTVWPGDSNAEAGSAGPSDDPNWKGSNEAVDASGQIGVSRYGKFTWDPSAATPAPVGGPGFWPVGGSGAGDEEEPSWPAASASSRYDSGSLDGYGDDGKAPWATASASAAGSYVSGSAGGHNGGHGEPSSSAYRSVYGNYSGADGGPSASSYSSGYRPSSVSSYSSVSGASSASSYNSGSINASSTGK
jgi:hypothetical protein